MRRKKKADEWVDWDKISWEVDKFTLKIGRFFAKEEKKLKLPKRKRTPAPFIEQTTFLQEYLDRAKQILDPNLEEILNVELGEKEKET